MACSLRDGLVAEYKYSNNVLDTSGSGYNGTNNGSTATTDKNGEANMARAFASASSQYIDLGTAWGAIDTAYSMLAWVKYSKDGSHRTILSKGQTSSGDILFYKNTSNQFSLFHRDNAGTFGNVTGSSSDWTDNEWTSVIVVRTSASLVTLYVNGIPVATNTTTIGTTTNAHNWIIGASNDGTGRFANGDMDELYYFDRALTSEEVFAFRRGYDASVCPSALYFARVL